MPVLRILRPHVAVATAFASFTLAPPAGAGPGVPIAKGARCNVSLFEISYDDPGADDAEFIELHVEEPAVVPPTGVGGFGGAGGSGAAPPCGAGSPPPDAGTGGFGGAETDAPHALTLGDCGLATLRLIDGKNGTCEAYRDIALADAPVPSDGFVVLCATDSALHANGECDVTTAGRSALKNGWLQNGPSDSLSFVGTDGSVLLEVGYESPLACGSPPVLLADETGEIAGGSGTPVDDVNVACDGRFALSPADTAPLRKPLPCDPADGSGNTGTGSAGSALDASAGPWGPGALGSGARAGTAYAPFPFDAGYAPPKITSKPPSVPGCSTSRARGLQGDRGSVLLFAYVAALWLMRRRRRGESWPAPRAGSYAHCGTSRSRSP